MTLTVSYFLNKGAKTRWCRSRGASAKFEKTIKLIYEHEVASADRAHDYAPASIFLYNFPTLGLHAL